MLFRRGGERCTAWGWASAIMCLGLAMLLGTLSAAPDVRHHSRSATRSVARLSAPQPTATAVTRRPPLIPITADAAPTGLLYAVTPAEVAAALDSLPKEWRETVRSVRLSYRPDTDVMA